jgi:hypothetical protein
MPFKLLDIAAPIAPALQNHLQAYAGCQQLLQGDFEQSISNKNLYQQLQTNTQLLHTNNVANTYLLQAGNDWLCCSTFTTNNQSFVSCFPQMLPADPFGVVSENDSPFPSLAAQTVQDAQWLYVYFSSTDDAVNNSLWQTILSIVPNIIKAPLTNPHSIDELKSIYSNQQLGDDETWQGGLLYMGSLTVFPFVENLNDDWTIFSPNLKVVGCVFYRFGLPQLSLQASLGNFTSPFGSDSLVRSIQFTGQLFCSLLPITDT